ncbi:unnamed protein product [Prorocentrum cordatum]|uniref:Apple domain-containing protein n=1 Tax=Prorocentrum cordatum TaxID=2364126 RepID=A0ABN9RWY3_9DINO|nr:unnamed protein product [Polarella glacialis]
MGPFFRNCFGAGCTSRTFTREVQMHALFKSGWCCAHQNVLWKRFLYLGDGFHVWFPWCQTMSFRVAAIIVLGLLIVGDIAILARRLSGKTVEQSRLWFGTTSSCSSPSLPTRVLDAPRRNLSGAASRSARAFLLEQLGLRLVLEPHAAGAGPFQAGRPTSLRVRAQFEGAPSSSTPCPSLAESLTLWAALIADGDQLDEQLVERADVEAVPAECAWRVSFSPREARAYDLHVRVLWVNATVEPAYGSCVGNAGNGKGWCLAGRRLVQRQGSFQAGREEVNLSSAGHPPEFCCDLCSSDERCYAWSLQGAVCTLLEAGSRMVPGNCTSGVPRSDSDQWRYLGGWSILQAPIKDVLRHAESHVWGSPMALGTPRPAAAAELRGRAAPCAPGACGYVQGPGRWRFGGQAPNLTADWEPEAGELPRYTRDEVGRCWQRQGITKIVMAGDSLVREQFNGLGSYLEDNFEAKRIHADSFWWRRPDGIDVHVEFIWFYTFFDIARAFWYNSERRASPSGFNDSLDAQLLVTNVNAVWQLWFDSDCAIERRLQQFVHAMRALPKPQQRIFIQLRCRAYPIHRLAVECSGWGRLWG